MEKRTHQTQPALGAGADRRETLADIERQMGESALNTLLAYPVQATVPDHAGFSRQVAGDVSSECERRDQVLASLALVASITAGGGQR